MRRPEVTAEKTADVICGEVRRGRAGIRRGAAGRIRASVAAAGLLAAVLLTGGAEVRAGVQVSEEAGGAVVCARTGPSSEKAGGAEARAGVQVSEEAGGAVVCARTGPSSEEAGGAGVLAGMERLAGAGGWDAAGDPENGLSEEPEDAGQQYLDHWLDELDFTDLDELLERELFPKQPEKLKFSGIVEAFLRDGITGFNYGSLVDWFVDALFYEVDTHRKLLLTAVMLAVAFSVLKNFSGGFRSAYISEISFLFIYCVLAVLLMQSFEVFAGIAGEALRQSTDFMKALVPTLCVSMIFSGGPETSAGFYQLAFLVIYLVEWLFLYVLMPLIHVYVILELFNHFFEDEKFENLTELLKNGIEWGMKSTGILVLGLNVVQGLVAPAKDRLTSGTISRAASLIPGVGSVVSGVGELLLGSGMLIRNCVGAAALLILVAIGLMPVLQILCMSVVYKLAAVLVEPLSDKRIAGCLKGMAEGGFLYLKLVVYCVALLFVTIALTTAVCGTV